MFTLMEDPVILPSSRVSIDRATIRSHLLSDPHDPFNRVLLKMEDVLPGTNFPPFVFSLLSKYPQLTYWRVYRQRAQGQDRGFQGGENGS